MPQAKGAFQGVIRGKTIELDGKPGLPDGQQVTVIVQPLEKCERLPSGEGIRRSSGAWADAGDQLDAWLREMQSSRQQDRPELI